jgi:hypothetical protein
VVPAMCITTGRHICIVAQGPVWKHRQPAETACCTVVASQVCCTACQLLQLQRSWTCHLSLYR